MKWVDADVELLRQYQKDPLLRIRDFFWITPTYLDYTAYEERIWSKDYRWDRLLYRWRSFEKWKTLTRQQTALFEWVKAAVAWTASNRITVKSWHGVGKSSSIALLILRFLFAFYNSQIGVTAPTQSQMFDVLWKEIWLWIQRLEDRHPALKWMYVKTSDRLSIKDMESTRFARARVARKENPEALAWFHGEHVMLLIDEASWVAEEIFESAKSVLTSKNTIFIMISNPTRLTWYFYASHTKLAHLFQTFSFSSLDSPIVAPGYINAIEAEHWRDSDDFAIRVNGEFPDAEWVDEKWYVPLLFEKDVNFTYDKSYAWDYRVLGVDPAWQWRDMTAWVMRDPYKAGIVAREQISTAKSIASKTIELMRNHWIPPHRVIVDNFWPGADVVKELALSGYDVCSLFVWWPAIQNKRFLNKRAELRWMAAEFLKKWGTLVFDNEWKQALTLKYKRQEWNDLIKMMSKEEMRKLWIDSPDFWDAFSMTFQIRDEWHTNVVAPDWSWWTATVDIPHQQAMLEYSKKVREKYKYWNDVITPVR